MADRDPTAGLSPYDILHVNPKASLEELFRAWKTEYGLHAPQPDEPIEEYYWRNAIDRAYRYLADANLKAIIDFGVPSEEEPREGSYRDGFQGYQFFNRISVIPVSDFTPEQLNATLKRVLTMLGNPDYMTEAGDIVLFYRDLARLIKLATQPPADDRYITIGLYLLLRRKNRLGREIFDDFYLKWSRGWSQGIPNDPFLLYGPRWVEIADVIESKVDGSLISSDCVKDLTNAYRKQIKKLR